MNGLKPFIIIDFPIAKKHIKLAKKKQICTFDDFYEKNPL
jgi:hypothetical protein